MNDNVKNESFQDHDNDEIDLRDLILSVWRGKAYIVLFTILLPLCFLVFHFSSYGMSTPSQYKQLVQFNFQGISDGKYPNGTQFRKTDIISDTLLERVHTDLNLDIPYNEFVQAISINSTPDFIEEIKKLSSEMSGKDLKGLPEESVQAYYSEFKKFMSSLNRDSNAYAELVINTSEIELTEEQANQIINTILSTWLNYMISEVGVLSNSDTTLNLSIKTLPDDDLIIAINSLFDYVKNFENRIARLSSTAPISKSLVATTDQLTLADIQFLLAQERANKLVVAQRLALQYVISSKDSLQNSYLETKIASLKLSIDELHGKIGVYDQALAIFDQSTSDNFDKVNSPDNNNRLAGSAGNLTTNPAGLGNRAQVYSPQYSDSFVNTMLDLGTKISDPVFRKSLISSKIETSNELEAVKSTLKFYTKSAFSNKIPTEEEVKELMYSSRESIESYRIAFNEISNKLSESLLNANGGLYSTIAKLQVQTGYKLNDSKFFLKLIVMGLAGGFLGLIFIFMRKLLRPEQQA